LAEIGVVRLLAVSAPVAFVLSGFRVIDDHAVIAVTVGDIQFICSLIDEQFRGALQVLRVIAALALARVADLHEEFAALRKFQDHVVMVALGIGAAAVAPNPDVAFVIDGDSVVRIRPIVTSPWAAPVADEITFFVELKNGGSRVATFRGRRLLGSIEFHAAEKPPAAECCYPAPDRKSTRLNSSHRTSSYADFCLKKKKKLDNT